MTSPSDVDTGAQATSRCLVVLRHGKAEPLNSEGDHRRRLTAGGRRAAQEIGYRLLSEIGVPDAVVSSDAERAQETASIAGEAMRFSEPIAWRPSLYDASLATLIREIRLIPDDAQTAVVVGHNPSFQQFSDWLAGGEPVISALPTAGAVVFTLKIGSWQEVSPDAARFVDLLVPDRH